MNVYVGSGRKVHLARQVRLGNAGLFRTECGFAGFLTTSLHETERPVNCKVCLKARRP